jgi:hypothetical protein
MKALAALRAACSSRERKVLALVYAGFAAFALLGAATDFPRRGELALVLLSLPTFFIWAGWFTRVLLLQRHAQAELLPGAGAMAAGAVGAATVATVLLPALLVIALGVHPSLALACFAGVAALGALFMLLPRGIAAMAGLAPMALNALGVGALLRSLHAPMLVPALAAIAVLATAWCWSALARSTSATRTSWSQPLLFVIGVRGSFWGVGRWGDPDARLAAQPGWLLPGRRLGNAGPDRPVTAMRNWLGVPFAPAAPWQWVAKTVAWLLLSALLWRWAESGHIGSASILQSLLLCLGASVLLLSYAMRLQAFKQARSAEMAELALLPGWGGNEAARWSLLSAIALPMAVAGGVVMAATVVAGIAFHDDGLRLALVVVAGTAICVLAATLCVRLLCGIVVEAPGKWLAVLAGIVLFSTTTPAFDLDQSPTWAVVALAEWLSVAAGGAIALRAAWARFRAMPHAFLA